MATPDAIQESPTALCCVFGTSASATSASILNTTKHGTNTLSHAKKSFFQEFIHTSVAEFNDAKQEKSDATKRPFGTPNTRLPFGLGKPKKLPGSGAFSFTQKRSLARGGPSLLGAEGMFYASRVLFAEQCAAVRAESNNVQASPAQVYGMLANLDGGLVGMDVFGRNAVDRAGEYFRASIWTWRALLELVARLCSDLVDERCLYDMQFNCGAGPRDPWVCRTMSERFRDWLSSWQDDTYFLEQTPTDETPESALMGLLEQQCPGCQVVPLRSDYWVERDELEAWTTFLERCGGFAVW